MKSRKRKNDNLPQEKTKSSRKVSPPLVGEDKGGVTKYKKLTYKKTPRMTKLSSGKNKQSPNPKRAFKRQTKKENALFAFFFSLSSRTRVYAEGSLSKSIKSFLPLLGGRSRSVLPLVGGVRGGKLHKTKKKVKEKQIQILNKIKKYIKYQKNYKKTTIFNPHQI